MIGSKRDIANTAADVFLLLFNVEDQPCAVATDQVREVVAIPELSRPAGTPPLLDGYLNIEQKPIAVVRLARLLGLTESEPDLYTPLIVLRGRAGDLALRVTDVHNIARVAPDDIRSLRDELVAVGSVMIDERVVAVLSADEVIKAKERQCIDELLRLEQQRMADLQPQAEAA